MENNKSPSDFIKGIMLISAFNVLSQEEQEAYIEATGHIEVNLGDAEVIGVCVECFADLTTEGKIPTHQNIYECLECGHPHHIERK